MVAQFLWRMKILTILASIALLVIPAQAQLSAVRLEVRPVAKTETSGKTHDTKNQSRALTITLQNMSKVQMDDLVVKYWFFARDEKSKDIHILKAGERKSTLAPSGKEEVETEKVESTYTDKHTEVSNAKGKGKPTVKKVEASGDKIAGHAVQVLQGGKIIAENYSEPSFKDKAH